MNSKTLMSFTILSFLLPTASFGLPIDPCSRNTYQRGIGVGNNNKGDESCTVPLHYHPVILNNEHSPIDRDVASGPEVVVKKPKSEDVEEKSVYD
jgi:hypothetical protein